MLFNVYGTTNRLLMLVCQVKSCYFLSFFLFVALSAVDGIKKKESELLHVCLGVGVEVLARHPSRQSAGRGFIQVDDATFFSSFFFLPFTRK